MLYVLFLYMLIYEAFIKGDVTHMKHSFGCQEERRVFFLDSQKEEISH